MVKWLIVNFRLLMNGGLWIRDKNIFFVDYVKLFILLGIGFFSGFVDFSRFWNENVNIDLWLIYFFFYIRNLIFVVD